MSAAQPSLRRPRVGVGALLSSYYDLPEGVEQSSNKGADGSSGASPPQDPRSGARPPPPPADDTAPDRGGKSTARTAEAPAERRNAADSSARAEYQRSNRDAESSVTHGNSRGAAAAAVNLRTSLDSQEFDVNLYFQDVVGKKQLKGVLSESNKLCGEIKTLDGDMQTLIYENYSKFINTTDTVRSMRVNVETMEGRLTSLQDTMKNIEASSRRLENVLSGRAKKIEELVSIRHLLCRLQYVLELPRSMMKLMANGEYLQALQLHSRCSPVLSRHCEISRMGDLAKRSDSLAQKCRTVLVGQLKNAGAPWQARTAGGVVLTPEGQPHAATMTCDNALNICDVLVRCERGTKSGDGSNTAGRRSNELLSLFLTTQSRLADKTISEIFQWDSLLDTAAASQQRGGGVAAAGGSVDHCKLSSSPGLAPELMTADAAGFRGACQAIGDLIVPSLVKVVEGVNKVFFSSTPSKTGTPSTAASVAPASPHVGPHDDTAADLVEAKKLVNDFVTILLHKLWLRLLLLAFKLIYSQIVGRNATPAQSDNSSEPPDTAESRDSRPASEPASPSGEDSSFSKLLFGVVTGVNTLRASLKRLHVLLPRLLADEFANFIIVTGRVVCAFRFIAACRCGMFEFLNMRKTFGAMLAVKSNSGSLTLVETSTRGIPPTAATATTASGANSTAIARDAVTRCEHATLLEACRGVTESEQLISCLIGPDASASRQSLSLVLTQLLSLFFEVIHVGMQLLNGNVTWQDVDASQSTKVDARRDILDVEWTALLTKLSSKESRLSASGLDDVLRMTEVGARQLAVEASLEVLRSSSDPRRFRKTVKLQSQEQSAGVDVCRDQYGTGAFLLALVRISRHFEVKGISKSWSMATELMVPEEDATLSAAAAELSCAGVTAFRAGAQRCLRSFIMCEGWRIATVLRSLLDDLVLRCEVNFSSGGKPKVIDSAIEDVIRLLWAAEERLAIFLGDAPAKRGAAQSQTNVSSGGASLTGVGGALHRSTAVSTSATGASSAWRSGGMMRVTRRRSPLFTRRNIENNDGVSSLDLWTMERLLWKKVKAFTPVEEVPFNRRRVVIAILRIGLRSFVEDIREHFFTIFSVQQLHLDCTFLSEMIRDTILDSEEELNAIDVILDEAITVACKRCLEQRAVEEIGTEPSSLMLLESSYLESICDHRRVEFGMGAE